MQNDAYTVIIITTNQSITKHNINSCMFVWRPFFLVFLGYQRPLSQDKRVP